MTLRRLLSDLGRLGGVLTTHQVVFGVFFKHQAPNPTLRCFLAPSLGAAVFFNTALFCVMVGVNHISLHINKNTGSEKHVDSNSQGVSAVLLLGNFTGGAFEAPGRGLN